MKVSGWVVCCVMVAIVVVIGEIYAFRVVPPGECYFTLRHRVHHTLTRILPTSSPCIIHQANYKHSDGHWDIVVVVIL